MCAPACNVSTDLARYFFHVRDGKDLPDQVGTDLPDLTAVRREAVKSAGEMLRDAASFWTGEEWVMTVLNDTGERVLALRFSAEA